MSPENRELFRTTSSRNKMRHTPEFRRTNYSWNQFHYNQKRILGLSMDDIITLQPHSRTIWENQALKLRCQRKNEEIPFSKLALKFAHHAQISLATAYVYIFIRGVDQFYEGYQREQQVQNYFQQLFTQQFPALTLQHSSGDIDAHYAVDFEMFQAEQLVAAIQVKPLSYRAWQQRGNRWGAGIDALNQEKHQQYFQRYQVPVYLWFWEKTFSQLYPEINDQIATLQQQLQALQQPQTLQRLHQSLIPTLSTLGPQKKK